VSERIHDELIAKIRESTRKNIEANDHLLRVAEERRQRRPWWQFWRARAST
jgi:hypothetical protein